MKEKTRKEKIALLREIMAGRRQISETLPPVEVVLLSTRKYSYPPNKENSPCQGYDYYEPLTKRCWTKKELEDYKLTFPQDNVTVIEIRRHIITRKSLDGAENNSDNPTNQ